MSSIELRDVSLVRRGRQLLENVDLRVDDGQTLAIIGPPNAGKSLLLQVLVGLVEPTSGEVLIDDEVVNDQPPRRRDLSMVFDDYALHPHLDVYENLAFSSTLRKHDADALDERIGEIAEVMELRDLLGSRPDELDEAHRQRVATGRAMVRDARAYLLDDPFSAQADRVRPHVRSVVLLWQGDQERTTILTTSDVDEALMAADQVAVMHQGFVHQIGTPQELYDQPADMFVAGYLGTPPMNLVPGFPEGDEIVTPLGPVRPSAEVREQIGDRQVIVLGLRPEHLTEGAASGFSFTAPVDDLEWRGRSQLAYFGYDIDPAVSEVLDEVEELVEFDLFQSFVVVDLPADRTLSPGTRLTIGARAEHVHLFDPVTGENLTS